HFRHGLADRPVARATAEIAGERVMNGLEIGLLAAPSEGIGRHHEARRAETALRGIALGQDALHGMDAILAAQAFDRPYRLAVDLTQKCNTGIHRLACAIGALQHDGARTAIPLGAALLGAFES